jgi:hypothetical protein
MSEANEVDGKILHETENLAIIYLHGAKAVHQKEMQKIQHPWSRPRAYIQLLQEPEIPFI